MHSQGEEKDLSWGNLTRVHDSNPAVGESQDLYIDDAVQFAKCFQLKRINLKDGVYQ